MSLKCIQYFIWFLTLCSHPFPILAQIGLCPSNLNFENSDFTNWVCRTGTVSTPGGVNTVLWGGTGQVTGRHTIISAATAGLDAYGGFSEMCPNGSGYSVKLGNSQGGAEAEGISYTYTIPSNLTVFSILFHYAVVLQNPDHRTEQQPRFVARIIDLTTNFPLPCVTFDFTASSSLPGFLPSPSDPDILYKDWTPISINLTNYIGKTIMIEFITSDCTRGGHFGYAYMDVNTTCNGAIGGSIICAGDTSITLAAPFGFQSYKWFSDNTFSQVLSNTQNLVLSPPPVVGSVFPVVVQPFPGFGCPDTLYATISISPRPVSIAGPDTTICKYQQIQLGTTAVSTYLYSWLPASQVSNPTISNPMAWNNSSQTMFTVKTTDILTNCYSYDTVVVATKQVDTSVVLSGNTEFCLGDTSTVALIVNNSSTAAQWYNASGIIPGATSLTYKPPTSGIYWASVTQGGCTDSTGHHAVNMIIHPLPHALFSPMNDTGCVTSNSFAFTNLSTVSDGSSMTYLWKFSDGSLQQVPNPTKTFANLGLYTVQLITSTAFGCKDSASGIINIFPNGIPAFSWDSICINRPVLFNNLSTEFNWPRVNYTWNFNNGGPGSLLRDPVPVIYSTAGQIDVTLTMTIVGCENDPRSITRRVAINKPVPGIRYRDIIVPGGNLWPIRVRDTVGDIYKWSPQIQLSNYSRKTAEFYGLDDVKYLIDITNKNTCVTTDTLQMFVLKKPGFYLPNAFTPNDDGLNDVITPRLVDAKSFKNFSIFNRWGNLVFYTTTYAKGWDGRYKGLKQPGGTYLYVLEFMDNNGKAVVKKGTIILVR